MICFLSESEVEAALSMPEAVAIVENAFRDLGTNGVTLLPRVSQVMPGNAGVFRILAATLPSRHVFGLKTLTGFPGRRIDGEIYFAVLLFELGSGALRAVVSANHATGLRTGAASGVAAKYLALESATSLGVIGTGVQAWFQVEALCAVRDVRTARVFSRDITKANAFAARVREELGVDALAAQSAEEAVRGNQLIVAATTSPEPVIKGSWLEPGMHISAIGANTRTKRELDARCFARARIVADSREQVLEESGDLRDAIQAGCLKPDPIDAELAELVAGVKLGRSTPEEITIFKSVGLALQDVAVAAALFEMAQEQGFGTRLDPYATNRDLIQQL